MASLLKVSYHSSTGQAYELPGDKITAFLQDRDTQQRINFLATAILRGKTDLQVTSLRYNSDSSLTLTIDEIPYVVTPINTGIFIRGNSQSGGLTNPMLSQSCWAIAGRIEHFALQSLLSQPAPATSSGVHGQPQVISGANGATTVIYGPCCHNSQGGMSGSNCLPVLLQIQQDLSRIAAALTALEQKLAGSRTQTRAPVDDRDGAYAIPTYSNAVHTPRSDEPEDESEQLAERLDAFTQQLQQSREKVEETAAAIAAAQQALLDD